jgi:signal transduction histidine kinase
MTFVVNDPISFAGRVLETVRAAVLAVDEHGVLRYASPAALRIVGAQMDDVLGCPIEEVLALPADEGTNPIRGCLSDGVARKGRDDVAEVSMGNGRPLQLDILPLTVDGKVAGALVTMNTDTDPDRPVSESVNAQKLEGLGRIAAGVAHEINTPTQYVNDNVHFLRDAVAVLGELIQAGDRIVEKSRRGEPVEDAIAELAAKTQQSGVTDLEREIPDALEQTLEGLSRINRIAGALREFLHPAADEKTAANINRAIENAVAVCRNEWRYVAEVELDFDEGLPSVSCWIHEFSQVILNLVTNAAHSIADRISGTPGEMGRITITTRKRDEFAEIRVCDDGAGIPSDLLHAIFAPFFTTKDTGKGTGQGLALARSVIVDKHSGSIEAESEMGEGAVFTILIPFRETSKEKKLESEGQVRGGLVR